MQMEIDYKAECHSGDAIESLGSSIKEDTNGTGIRRLARFSACCAVECVKCVFVLLKDCMRKLRTPSHAAGLTSSSLHT